MSAIIEGSTISFQPTLQQDGVAVDISTASSMAVELYSEMGPGVETVTATHVTDGTDGAMTASTTALTPGLYRAYPYALVGATVYYGAPKEYRVLKRGWR